MSELGPANVIEINKLWVTKDIKVILNEKKKAFRAGNSEGVRTIQGELKVRIREAKPPLLLLSLTPPILQCEPTFVWLPD